MYTIARRLAGFEHDDLPLQKDISAARALFQRCIDEHNHVGALLDLAKLLQKPYMSSYANFHRIAALYEAHIVQSNSIETKFRLAKLLDYNLNSALPSQVQSVRAVPLYASYIEQTGSTEAKYNLARLLTQGARGVKKDVSRALELYENCMQQHYRVKAVEQVFKIIMSGADGVETNGVHALRIMEKSLSPLFLVKFVCSRLSKNRSRLCSSRSVRYVVRLLEMGVAKYNDRNAMVILADILLTGAPQVDRDINRGLQLCVAALELEEQTFLFQISDIVRQFVAVPWRISENALLAALLCDLCIEKDCDDDTKVLLAEILMTGAPGVEKDIDRAVQLCKLSLLGSTTCNTVTDLAEKVAYGMCGMVRDVCVAVQLCEMCIQIRSDGKAMMILAGILVNGAPGIEKDVPRVVDLCHDYLWTRRDMLSFYNGVVILARKIAYESFDTPEVVEVAMSLCEECIEKRSDSTAMILQIELYMAGAGGIVANVDHAMRLCEKYLRVDGFCNELTDLAKKIMNGKSRVAKDVKLVVQLCELCIDKKKDRRAKLILAEILLTEVASVRMYVDHGIELCKEYVSQYGYTTTLTDLLRNIAYGGYGKRKNVPLAIQLCEMCIEKKNDAEVMMILGDMLMHEGMDGQKYVDRAWRIIKDWLTRIQNFNNANELYQLKKLLKEMSIGKDLLAKNIPLAIDFFDMLRGTGCPWSAATLGEILLTGGSETEHIKRGLQLCQESLDYLYDWGQMNAIADLAKQLMCREHRTAENNQLALRLAEMCIAAWNDHHHDSSFPPAIAEVLITTATDSKDIDRAVHQCQVAIDRSIDSCTDIAKVARNVASGTSGMERDTALAIRLCKMCIEKTSDALAIVTVAEIFIAGTPEMERNIIYAMNLCEWSVTENRHENLVPFLARSIAAGTKWMEGDAALAVKLCEMCVEKRRDVRAMVVLSEIYSMGGCGVKMNMGKARDWYQRATVEGWLLCKPRQNRITYVHDLSPKYTL